MTSFVQSPLTPEQTVAWVRGLLTLAWADGDFETHEQELITDLTHSELGIDRDWHTLEPIQPQALADAIGADAQLSANFLRTAVLVAIADGVYSASEDDLLQEFCQVLGQDCAILTTLRHTLVAHPAESETQELSGLAPVSPHAHAPDLLEPVREWLDHWEVHDPKLARFVCKLIPPQCPFERDIKLFGHKIVHIPPLCKLNPLYDQLVGLRFRALSYLADECGEDVTPFC